MDPTSAALQNLPEPEPRRIYLALELSKDSWVLAISDGGKRVLMKGIPPGDKDALAWKVAAAKKRFELPEGAEVKSCYEAGRDGFWVHRFLERLGIQNVVVDPASMKVDRKARRAKSDRLDAGRLLSDLIRYHRGDENVWAVVHVPSEGDEDARRLHRGLGGLKKERTTLRSRLSSLLATEGIRLVLKDSTLKRITTLRNWAGEPLPPALKAELERVAERLDLVESQIRSIEKEQADRVQNREDPAMKAIARLAELCGIGIDSAWLLVMEFFSWRSFANRREVAGAAGLGGTPYSSGKTNREQGISKAATRGSAPA